MDSPTYTVEILFIYGGKQTYYLSSTECERLEQFLASEGEPGRRRIATLTVFHRPAADARPQRLLLDIEQIACLTLQQLPLPDHR